MIAARHDSDLPTAPQAAEDIDLPADHIDDQVTAYLREIGRRPLLSAEEECDLSAVTLRTH